MDTNNNNSYPFIIQKKEVKNQSYIKDLLIVIIIILIFSLLFTWSYNIYININNINIINDINDIEMDGIDMNYLIEQNHYKQLVETDKQLYKQLSNQDKILNIKKQLMKNILS